MNKVYFPIISVTFGAEIASTMGDHEAVKTTVGLKSEMEIELAERTADAAEGFNPPGEDRKGQD